MALSVVSKAHLFLDVGKIYDRGEKIRNPKEAQTLINKRVKKASVLLTDFMVYVQESPLKLTLKHITWHSSIENVT